MNLVCKSVHILLFDNEFWILELIPWLIKSVLYFNFFFDLYMLKLCQVSRKFTSKVEGKMNYEDFVHFILAEEDKSSQPSLEYWYTTRPSQILGILLGAWKTMSLLIYSNFDLCWNFSNNNMENVGVRLPIMYFITVEIPHLLGIWPK